MHSWHTKIACNRRNKKEETLTFRESPGRAQCILATLLKPQKRKTTTTTLRQSTCLYKGAKFFHLFYIRVLPLKTQMTLTAPEKQWLSTPKHSSLNPSHLINFDWNFPCATGKCHFHILENKYSRAKFVKNIHRAAISYLGTCFSL